MFPSLGLGELILILIVALLLFGKRLPEVSRSVGKGIREFQKGMRGIEEEIRREVNTEPLSTLNQPPAPSGGLAGAPSGSPAGAPSGSPPGSPSGGPAGARVDGPPPGTEGGAPA